MQTLESMTQAVRLTGLKWICCLCKTVNKPSSVECAGCDKQRWEQLGFGRIEAIATAELINAEGHGL